MPRPPILARPIERLGPAGIAYQYDALNRLVQVTYADGAAIVYEYGAVGNRTLRVVNSDAATVYLDVQVDPPCNGSVIRDPDQTWYPFGTPVELTAVGSGACAFVEWTGDVPAGQEHENPLTIIADAYKSITAHLQWLMGDANCDCDLDLADFAGFQQCFDESPVSAECSMFDFDESDAIDLTDFDEFSQVITGPSE